jgi:micrococcal nuclease
MTRNAKSKSGIVVSLITLLLSVGVSAAFGQPINFQQLSQEVLGVRVGGANSKSGKCLPNNVEVAKFERAVDGDTLEVLGGCDNKIRLLYIDTPETVKPNTPVGCYGPEASNHTKKAFQIGQTLYLKSDKEAVDRYGRSLRILYQNKEDIDNFKKSYNYELVSNGFGYAKFYSPNTTYKKEMIEGENTAKSSKLGLWKACNL